MFSINPYVAGNPVGDSPAFIGRADVLRGVLRVLRHPQENAIVLYGQRRIGKTSVLQELEATLPKKGGYRPILFDLESKAQWPLERVLQELAQKISDQLGQPKPDLRDNPKTTFCQVWLPELLNSLSQDTSLVLLFDEFDVLADPKSEKAGAAFFPYLRDLLTTNQKRLNSVFVIGRKVDDLTNIALSLFKNTPALRVSLLSHEDTVKLIRLSETNKSLDWSKDAIEKVWQLTSGHPFFTQRLCSNVWEFFYDDNSNKPLKATVENVELAISETLSASRNALEWLWNGLPPAERVVISALAEAGTKTITEKELEQLLHESGVRVVIRELRNAPHLLQEWDLIEPVDGGYRFLVELLRRWIADYKPLSRVQEELDRIEPVADHLYEAGKGLYSNGQLEVALAPLRQAVLLNPNHIGANQLLADILLAQGQASEACEVLEKIYESQPIVARSRLIQTLLVLAQENGGGEEQLKYYERVLELDAEQPEAKNRLIQSLLALAQASNKEEEQLKYYEQILKLDAKQPEAKNGRLRIWQQRGDEAYKAGDLETALVAYKKVNLIDKISKVKQNIQHRELERQGDEAYQKGDLKTALVTYKNAQLNDKVAKVKREIQYYDLLSILTPAEQAKLYQHTLKQERQLADELVNYQRLENSLKQLFDEYKHELTQLNNEVSQLWDNLYFEEQALKVQNPANTAQTTEAMENALYKKRTQLWDELDSKEQYLQKLADTVQKIKGVIESPLFDKEERVWERKVRERKQLRKEAIKEAKQKQKQQEIAAKELEKQEREIWEKKEREMKKAGEQFEIKRRWKNYF
jgi:tetratricopeptide (TPR) repeat protein